jgi:uncharacterized iron-regulated membrane protein
MTTQAMPTQTSTKHLRGDSPPTHGKRRMARVMFYTHLWAGLIATGILLVVSVTGILLNHKTALGFMPDVSHQPSGEFSAALTMAELGSAAERAVAPEIASSGIDRMDVRPSKGLIKVRFGDRRVMEVTLDIHSGEVLHVGERNDVFLERLHSGEIFGGLWTLLSDAAAVLVLLLMGTGYWLWLYPKTRI